MLRGLTEFQPEMILNLYDNLEFLIRLIIATGAGGLIGLERSRRFKEAGVRTHCIVALSAALFMILSKYAFIDVAELSLNKTDNARIAAQVVSGISFLGAGIIFKQGKSGVKGLTTAAGLWVSAIVGLAIGAGFYEAGLYTTAVILIAEVLFAKLEYKLIEKTPEVSLYVECAEKKCIDTMLQVLREKKIKITNFATTHISESGKSNSCVIITVRTNKKYKAEELIKDISKNDGVVLIERV